MEHSLLSQPNVFLLSLLEAMDDELAFYSQDFAGKFVYLSKSAERVLNLPHDLWKSKTFQEVFSDAPYNQQIKCGPLDNASRNPISAIKRQCEILDREGNRLKLEIWQTQVLHQGVPIGLTGIIRRLYEGAGETQEVSQEEERALEKRVSALTPVERQVIELVVDGHMNKKMAATLDVAVRTIESRRSRAMAKLEVNSLSQLVQLWVQVRRLESRKHKKG